ncbi:protein kinase [Actinomycetaceae bacterium MB13-C1-2]|nr:protein kinase [Actinomycetaceae bacterium MB13-C1-2]
MSNGSVPPPRGIRAGRTLGGRYTLVSRIAKGGMGEVWRVRDQRTGMMVAAKVLRPELRGEVISLSRLRLEASNTLRARHPNIAAVLDSGEDDGQGWIVMELIDGHPLTDYVGDGKRLSAQQLIPILAQSAYALDASAAAGVVHRDIKPANIMIRPDGVVKLTDFGISFAEGQANLTAVGMVMGTAQYLAPEQALGEDATSLGDLYALGVIAYEALAGRRPFTGKSAVEIAMSHVKDEVPALPSDVPELIQQVVYDLLAKKPEDRPQSGAALIRTLSRVASELDVTTSPVPLPPPAQMADNAQPTVTPTQPPRVVSDQKRDPELGTDIPVEPAPMTAAGTQTAGPPPPQAAAKTPAPATPVGLPTRKQGPSLPDGTAGQESRERTPSVLDEPVGSPTRKKPQRSPERVPSLPDGSAGSPAPKPTFRPSEQAVSSQDEHQVPLAASRAANPWHPVSRGLTGEPPAPLPRGTRTAGRPEAESVDSASQDQDSPISSRVGMWLIGALVILTVILILIAMVRDRGSADIALGFSTAQAVSSTEVQTWLIPALGC